MYVDGKLVIYIVDKDKKITLAFFLQVESPESVWESFVQILVTPYVGYPDEIAADQGPQFNSSEWKNLLQSVDIKDWSSRA